MTGMNKEQTGRVGEIVRIAKKTGLLFDYQLLFLKYVQIKDRNNVNDTVSIVTEYDQYSLSCNRKV